jgi:hypothetical protein
MRNKEEEESDLESEAEFWRQYEGKTDCFGTVAKLVMLMAILVKVVWQTLA